MIDRYLNRTNILQEDIITTQFVAPIIERYSIDRAIPDTNKYTVSYEFRLFIHFKKSYETAPPCYYLFYVDLCENKYEIYLLEREINNKLIEFVLNYLVNNNVIYKIDDTTYRLTPNVLLELT